MACHRPCRPWGSCRFTATPSRWWLLLDTRQPFEVFPSPTAALPSHIPQTSWIPLHRLRIPSRRWSALSASPRHESMSPSLHTAARTPLSATSGSCAIDESVVSAASSDRAPVTPMGFASAWLEKSSDLHAVPPRGHEASIEKVKRSELVCTRPLGQLPPTSSSTIQVPRHPDSTPTTDALRSRPPGTALLLPREVEELRVSGLEGLPAVLRSQRIAVRWLVSSPRCSPQHCPERRDAACSGLVSFFSHPAGFRFTPRRRCA
jgi:hypothetical protein